jgi:AraC-like DNA-binding protein
MEKYTTTAAWVRGVLDLFEGQGINTAVLCIEAGVNRETLANPETSCPTDAISLLWERAAARDPAISLAAAKGVRPANYGAVGYAMMSCPNLLTSLERLIRYVRLVSTAVSLELVQEGEETCLTFGLVGGKREAPRQRYEFDLLTLLTFCRWISGGLEINPSTVELTHPRPSYSDRYRDAFKCELRFDADKHRVRFSTAQLLQTLPTANPMLAQLHERFALEQLTKVDKSRFDLRVRVAIQRKLPDGLPLRDEIATAMGMSGKTLHRRLEEEGTSFQGILDATQHELTEQYLQQPNLSIGQIAYLLGFSDQSNFHRACKRWLGMSPTQYRQMHGLRLQENPENSDADSQNSSTY